MTEKKNKILGCLLGGAVGDALGYPVEFLQYDTILEVYGKYGICAYDRNNAQHKALISDDTQMTLFTANGLLLYENARAMGEIAKLPRQYVKETYLDWLKTQQILDAKAKGVSWLLQVPQLYDLRAPGNTCLSALEEQSMDVEIEDYILHPMNDSKGCGGVMRVAPVGCLPWEDMEKMDWEAAQIAAITHGHPLGYMTGAVLAHIVHRIIFPAEEKQTLNQIILEAKDAVAALFAGNRYVDAMVTKIEQAVELSENLKEDVENIHTLGGGWVAEETLAIAIYCALRYEDNFSEGVIAAVNHDGDSDSTGAVTGNILGAWLGNDSIDAQWKENLECYDILMEMAADLDCVYPKKTDVKYMEWEEKYGK